MLPGKLTVGISDRPSLCLILYRYMFERGRYSDLMPYTSVALDVLNHMNQSRSLDAGLILNTRGSTELETGRFPEAAEYLEDVLNIRKALLRRGDPVISNSMHNLSFALGCQGNYLEAAKICLETINIRESLPDAQYREWKLKALPKNYTTYCRLLHLLKDLDGAVYWGRKAIAIAHEGIGQRHQNTAQYVLPPLSKSPMCKYTALEAKPSLTKG